jgi:hypothetical protein
MIDALPADYMSFLGGRREKVQQEFLLPPERRSAAPKRTTPCALDTVKPFLYKTNRLTGKDERKNRGIWA